MLTPRVVLVSATSVVSEEVLVARIEALAPLPATSRHGVAVMLRDPELSGSALYALGSRLRAVTTRVGAALVVNDRLDLALLLRADGVHLGRRSVRVRDARAVLGAHAFVSVACHAPSDVVEAAEAGADAVTLSPIFASPGKGTPLGLDAITEALLAVTARGLAPIHVVALGGIDARNAAACFDAGASGVAAIRADLTRVALRL